jgi:RNA polymerase sigma-70 factor (ECF subfamily)
MRFFASLQSFQVGRPVQPWLYQIVRNQGRDLRRRQRVRPTAPLESDLGLAAREVPSPRPGPEEEARLKELQGFVWKALEGISADFREILVLRDYQDLSYREISEVVGIPMGTGMSRLHAARSRLRLLVTRRISVGGDSDV